MNPQPVDLVSAEPRTVSARVVWVLTVALLAVALAAAITIAVHYHGEVAALRRQLRSAPTASLPRTSVPPTLSSGTVVLPASGALNGVVTVVSAKSSRGLARIVLFVHISGGRPHTSYALTSFDCAGSTGYQWWAAGVTDVDGSGTLSGPAWTVSLSDEYWLYLSPSSSGRVGPGLDGRFTAAGTFSASPASNPVCS